VTMVPAGPVMDTQPRLPVRGRGPWRLVLHQVRCDLRVLGRNRQVRSFTLAMPIGLLVIFVAIFGNYQIRVEGHSLKESTYYVANLIAFGIVNAAFMSLGIAMVGQREAGLLKRRRATPEPAWVLVVGKALTATLGSLLIAAVLIAFSWIAYSATVPLQTAVALAVTIVIGTIAFCALGFAASTMVQSADAAQPVIGALAMPLFFFSGVFIPWPLIPPWLREIAVVFPVRHFARAVLLPFDPRTAGSGFAWGDLAIVGLWGLVGLGLAVRRFTWSPRVDSSGQGRTLAHRMTGLLNGLFDRVRSPKAPTAAEDGTVGRLG